MQFATVCAIINMDNGILVPNNCNISGDFFVMSDSISKKRIILASASPRRRDILAGMGATFEILCADADESSDERDPEKLTRELARRKADAALSLLRARGEDEGAIIIAADTVVACEGEILGKPHDRDDALRMIRLLSGRDHVVASGIAVCYNGRILTDCSVTRVHVDDIPEDEIARYVDTGEPYDKAGGYGIQGGFSRWVSGIDGCYFGVVGLPANKLSRLFHACVGVYPDMIK